MPSLLVRHARPNEILHGRVSLARVGGRLELRIHPAADVDPAAFEPMSKIGADGLDQLLPVLRPGRPPTVRYFVERNLPGGKLVAADLEPYQADIYIEHGLMSQEVADEIAGHSTRLFRRLTPPI